MVVVRACCKNVEGTASSDFFMEGLILYPRCALFIDYFDELMYVYTCTVLKKLYSMCTQHALCIVNFIQEYSAFASCPSSSFKHIINGNNYNFTV